MAKTVYSPFPRPRIILTYFLPMGKQLDDTCRIFRNSSTREKLNNAYAIKIVVHLGEHCASFITRGLLHNIARIMPVDKVNELVE